MNYGLYYKDVVFNRQAMNIVNRVLSGDLNWERGKIFNSRQSNRSSEIAWLGDKDLLTMLLRMQKKLIEMLVGI